MVRMVRPCTLPSAWVGVFNGKDSPFVIDAVRFEGLHYTPSTSYNPEEYFLVRVDLCNPKTTVMAYHPKENVDHLMRRTLGVIHEALNAPVLATKEVLAGLPKDVQFLVYRAWGDPPKENPFQHCNLHPAYLFRKNDKEAYNWYFTDAIIVDKGLRHSPVLGFHIKSNGCPKTAKYLLHFHTDGTPVSKGGE